MFWLRLVRLGRKTGWTLSLATLMVVSICFVSCSVATAPAFFEKGREFSWENRAGIEKGMETAEVLSVLGQPFETKEQGKIVRWRYYQRVRQDDIVRILGFIPCRKVFSRWEREVGVIFRQGRVEEVWTREVDLLKSPRNN
jgi:outer membrane protein assembly factor BamE (lipoprotein component of BamABCDE complex)